MLGAAHIGRALVEALHEEHEITVIDIDAEPARRARRAATTSAPSRATARPSRSSARRAWRTPTCSSAAARARRPTSSARCSSSGCRARRRSCARPARAYLDAWRERHLDVDFMVSPELETANAIVGDVGLPAARQTDMFADGKVQVVEFDVPARRGARRPHRPRRCAAPRYPPSPRSPRIIRGERMIVPRGDEQILPGDRVVVIASPASARAWSHACGRNEERVDDVVIFGAGQMGTTIAARPARARHPRPDRRRPARSRARGRRAPAGRARVPRPRLRPGVPRARAHRPRDRRRLRPQRRCAQPLRRDPRQAPRRAHDDRARARRGVGRRLRGRRRRRHDQPAPDHRRGDGPLRPRPAHPPDRDARAATASRSST